LTLPGEKEVERGEKEDANVGMRTGKEKRSQKEAGGG
jgi:hypothetical protein